MSSNRCSVHQCTRRGRLRPIIQLRAHEFHEPAEAAMGFRICQVHASEATVDDFITPEGWDRITRAVVESGKMMPDRDLCTLRFEPIQPKVT